VADYNGDDRPDLIWEYAATGDLYAWFMAGPVLAQGTFLTPGRVNTMWQIRGPR
jgi:hypothetical protein